MSWLRRMLLSPRYLPVMSAVLLVMVVAVGAEALARSGSWPPAIFRSRPAILITGPGTGSDTAPSLQVYVLGAVRSPGVYSLPEGARVRDLVADAGGLLSIADVARIDFAAPVADGQEVYIPRVGEQVPPELGGKLDINRASAEQMHDALGISLSIARRIVAYRAAHGAFTAVSQLLLVPITRATYDRIRDLITI